MFRVDLLPINPLNNINNIHPFPNNRPLPVFHSAADISNTQKALMSNYETTLKLAIKRFDNPQLTSKKLCLRGVKDLKKMAEIITEESALAADARQVQSWIKAYSGYVARVSPQCNNQFGVNLRNAVVNTAEEAIKEARLNNKQVRLENKIQRLGEMRNKLADKNNFLYDDLRTFSNSDLPRNPIFYNHRKTIDPLAPRNHLARDDLACRHNLASLDTLAGGLPEYFAETRADIAENCNNLEVINQKLIALTIDHRH